MRNLKTIVLLSFGMTLVSLTCNAQTDYTVKGKISGWPTETVYLVRQGDYEGVDSVKTSDGSFEFKGKIEGPTKAYLITKKRSGVAKFLYIEPGTITINGNFSSFKEVDVQGSPSYSDFLKLQAGHEDIAFKTAQLSQQTEESTDSEEIDAINNSIDSLNRANIQFSQQFIKDHPNSVVSLEEIKSLSTILDKGILMDLYNGLSEKVKQTPTGVMIGDALQNVNNNAGIEESSNTIGK